MSLLRVHDAYTELARKVPDSIAVIEASSGTQYSYSDLMRVSSQLSNIFSKQLEVKSIAISVRRSALLIHSYIASSIAGCYLIPLATWAEARRHGIQREKWENSVKFAISEGQVTHVLIEDEDDDLEVIARSLDPPIQLVRVSAIHDALAKDSSVEINIDARSESVPILKLLSGGSTGDPKLYSIDHGMVLSELQNYPRTLGISGNVFPTFRVLQQSPSVWPASLFGQVNLALALTGTLVITSEKDPQRVVADIIRYNVTAIGGAPSQLIAFSDFWPSDYKLDAVYTWGEPLSRPQGLRIRDTLCGSNLVVELLVATEYWLCMYCSDLSGCFSTVPNCKLTVVDADESGVGQLQLAGPMVAGSTMTTMDLVRVEKGKVQFVGRKDFLTKIGGNWFDVRSLESALVEAGQNLSPGIADVAVISRNQCHTALISIQPESHGSCDTAAWMDYVHEVIQNVAPAVTLHVRTVAVPFPKIAETGKTDRRAVIAMLDKAALVVDEATTLDSVPRNRFMRELVSQAKWSAILALVMGKHALLAPYMYLVTLYLPRSAYLPKAKVYSLISQSLSSLIDGVRWEFPFGRLGLMLLIKLAATRNRFARRILFAWAAFGIWLAARRGRLVCWWVTFWVGAGADIRDEAGYWLRSRKWKKFISSISFLLRSIPDCILGTNFCRDWDETVRSSEFNEPMPTEARKASIDDGDGIDDFERRRSNVVEEDKSAPVAETSPVDAETEWWNKCTVDYVSGSFQAVRSRPSDIHMISEDDSIDSFVVHALGLAGMRVEGPSSGLQGLSSLQTTELVQRLRRRIPAISARAVMNCATVQALTELAKSLFNVSLEAQSTPVPPQKPYEARIQFSPGQVNRPCRWMIRSRNPVDRGRLKRSLDKLVERHPLLRAELADPKQYHSFIHDAGVLVVNAKRFLPNFAKYIDLISRNVYAAWTRVAVYPPGARPCHWVDVLRSSKAETFDHLRRAIMWARRDLEDPWFTFQTPLTAIVFTLAATGQEYILLSVKHSLSDGNSAFPLIDELALLYDETAETELPQPSGDPVAELERRFKDGILVNPNNPNRTSLRTQMFYSKTAQELGGGYYRHYLCFEPSTIAAMRTIAAESLHVGFDSLFLSILVLGFMRADESDSAALTLYCPLRDGPGESSYIGLLADWRDLVVTALPGATVLDLVTDVAKRIRYREWEPTLSPAGPERVLLNWLPFDGTPRLKDKSWEPYHLDKITMRWNKLDTRDYDPRETPSGRFRSLSLEQYDSQGQWWLRFDAATRIYPPQWMMRFVSSVNAVMHAVGTNPLVLARD